MKKCIQIGLFFSVVSFFYMQTIMAASVKGSQQKKTARSVATTAKAPAAVTPTTPTKGPATVPVHTESGATKAESSGGSNSQTGATPGASVATSNSVNKVETVAVGEEKPVLNNNSESKKKSKKKENTEDDKIDEPFEYNDQKGILAGLDYPELQVVPRASERLAFESQDEKSRIVSPYWPIQVSAITLIAASFMSKGKYKDNSTDEGKNESRKKENTFSTQLALLTGGLWLGSTYYLSHYMSYSESLQDIKKINGKDKKSALLRERLAEEAIERPARVTYLVNTLSVWTTLFCSMYIAGNTTQLSPSYAGLATALAFMPWLIDNRITRNWEKHQEYKRKIYAPLTMGNFDYDFTTKEWRPQLTFNWTF
jgi:hypothetical protein